MFPWHVLETIEGQIALPSEWRTYLGEYFASFHDAFLDPTSHRAKTFPCARYPGYFRTLQFHEDGSATAPCHLLDERCPTLNLTDADVTLWELNWSKLGLALCRALGLDTKYSEFDLDNTSQIGSWSADAVPVFLTIQSQTDDLRAVIDGLVARLPGRFILLCPTILAWTPATRSGSRMISWPCGSSKKSTSTTSPPTPPPPWSRPPLKS